MITIGDYDAKIVGLEDIKWVDPILKDVWSLNITKIYINSL